MPNSGRLYLVLLVAAALVSVAAGYFGRQLNANAYDLFFRLRGPEPQGTDGITIVAIDDPTLKTLGRLPLDRRKVAQALTTICAARPATVGIDMWFPEASQPDADAALESALRGCEHAVLGASLINVPGNVAWSESVPQLAQAAAAVGHVHADPDEDGVNRQVLLEETGDRQRHWALAFECFRQMEPSTSKLLETDDGLLWGWLNIPAPRSARRAMLVNFAGDEGIFRSVSFADVLAGKIPASAFAGKAVFIGVTAQGAGDDRKFTPLSISGIGMPGVEIHANLLHTILERRFILPMRESSVLGLMFLLVALAGAAIYFLRGFRLALALVALFAATHVAPYLFFLSRQILPAFSLAATFWAPLVLNGTFQYLTVWRSFLSADASKRRLRQQMDFVTHEMRSPLTAIQGSSELISRYPLDEKKRKQMADLIHRESQRLARMVERFLDVERLEAGEIELRRDPVDLRAVAELSAERVRPLAERKGIAVELALDDLGHAEGEVLGDEELLEFAVYNLLSNAVKYSPEQSRVRLSAALSGGRAALTVSDEGEGISKNDAAHIFDRFYRTSEAEKSGKPGLGLGLAIVREIARHHRGEVSVESEPGRGSRFTLTVPLAPVKAR